VALAGLLRYVDERAAVADAPDPPGGGQGRPVRNPALLLIGLLTLCATVIEGAADDWLALYLHTGRGLSEAAAALGYAAFATAMTVVRFAGTSVTARLGRAGAVRAGGVLGVAGVLVTVLSPWTPVTFAGALLWGAGVCLVFPAAVSAAGETGRPAESIALVTSIGYGSILIGPPLIGALADVIGMGAALLTLAALAAAVAALAPAVRQAPGPGPAAGSPAAGGSDQSGSASIAR
jgi:fucose permease